MRSDGSSYFFFSAQDPRTRFFTDLGFVAPADLDELTGDSFYTEISGERVELLDRDLIVFSQASYLPEGADTILNDPLLSQLDAIKEGRFVILSEELDGAFSVSSVLSLPYALEELVSQLAAALETETTAEAEFPVTIEHKFGSTTIEAVPERVVSVGYSEQDALLALGVVPIAVRDWFGEQPYGIWPWSQAALGDAEPTLMQMPFGELNFEQIAALDPDLIVATHSGITEDEYEFLAEIAPVLAQPAEYEDFGVPWQVQTELIGQAIGRSSEAAQLIINVDEGIAAAHEANDGFGGATVAWVTPAGDGSFWVTGENTPPMRFLARLGLVNDPVLQEIVDGTSAVQISQEQFNLLDVDLLILRTPDEESRAALEADPLLSQLDVFQDGRVIFFVGNDPIYGALSFSTVASLPYVLDEFVPMIAGQLNQ